MKQGRPILLIAIALCGSILRADSEQPARPDLSTATSIATCQVKTLAAAAQATYGREPVLYSLQPPEEDQLANYERTPLGDWQMPAEADRSNPWVRLLLMAQERPLVIDVAVLVDGKSFREKREAWVDEVLAAAKSPQGVNSHSGNNPVSELGTNESDSASENGLPPGAKNEPDDGKEKPPSGVATQSRQAPPMRARLITYLTTIGAEVDRKEIHWLIAEWGAGPALVVLGPSLAWQRASMAPLLACLDQDADGGLSAAEIAQSQDRMNRADMNGDDVVETGELRRVTSGPLTVTSASGHALVVPLDANTDWDALAANVVRIYGRHKSGASEASVAPTLRDRMVRGDPSLVGSDIRGLCSAPADITLRVDFHSGKHDEKQTSELSALSLGSELAANNDCVVATSDVISIDIGGDFVEFSAAQAPTVDITDVTASQLAIGAVIDGNPLERLLDRDQDGRFTQRERQELAGLLSALDGDQDGQVAADEIPTPIRLAVTLGPRVHELLATPTGSARTIAPRDVSAQPPDWFASMDKNSDRDLSREEFLGTTEQFRQFDADSDGLLSVAEVLKLNGGQ
jgi:Ca2+-binding EF-hand superfamily protein